MKDHEHERGRQKLYVVSWTSFFKRIHEELPEKTKNEKKIDDGLLDKLSKFSVTAVYLSLSTFPRESTET
jgi:hypothetical protein